MMGRYYQSSGPDPDRPSAYRERRREGWRAAKLMLLRGTIAPLIV